MESTDTPQDRRPAGDPESDAPPISAHSTSEDRTVFTESGNGDGWIATDLTVEPDC
jgi:hypothetical protein